mgnify:FL=1
MVIESLLLKKKVIVLGHKSKSIFNHYNHIVKLNHFDGVEKLKDVKICWNLQNLEKMCNDIKLKKIITRKNKKIKLNHFIHYNKLSYSKKLLEITQKII